MEESEIQGDKNAGSSVLRRSSRRNAGKNMQTSTRNSVKSPVPKPRDLPVICFPNPVDESAAGSAKSKRGRKKVIDASVKQKGRSKISEVAFDNSSTTTASSSKKCMPAPTGLVLNGNGEEEYNVEKIITKQLIDGVAHYRVKWEGWDSIYNTWEPIENLSSCRDLINDFNAGYQLDSEMNVPAQKCRGKPRPGRKPRQEDSNNPLEKATVAATCSQPINDGDRILSEELDRQFMGPMFRRHWRQSEVPICVLGSSNIHGELVHLVRIKTEHDADNLMEDPYEGLDESNCVMVLAQTFNCFFSQLILSYYQAHAKFAMDTESGDFKAVKAARIEILRLCRTQRIHVDEKRLFQDILQQPTTDATVTGGFADSHNSATAQEPDSVNKVGAGFSHLSLSSFTSKTASVSEIDKFGLPQSISSSDDSEDDASSSNEVTKNFMRNRKKSTKRQLLESDEEEHGKNFSDAGINNTKIKRKAIWKRKPDTDCDQ